MKKKKYPDTIATNRKALHDYEISEKFEAGIILEGPEVKSLRIKQVSLEQSFARIEDGEIYLYGMRIAPYVYNTAIEIDPVKTRKLLLKKKEIKKIENLVSKKGMALIPISVYLKKGWIKLQLAVCKGRKIHDKHEKIKKQEADRELRREFKEKYKG
ncbi:MAG: SsrA-binding protein SmpB [Elusimicrobia bacterium]|nr:SsrA-binding protein SmpB [Elusimicrobiota bacterium]